MAAGQPMPLRSYRRVAGIDASARPKVPAPIIIPRPRAGEAGTSWLAMASALTIANSNPTTAITSTTRPTARCWCHTASANALGIISPAPSAVLRSFPHRSVRRADVIDDANSPRPNAKVTADSAAGVKSNESSSQPPNVTNRH